MSVTALGSGSQALTVGGGPHYVQDVSTAGVFVLLVDLDPLQDGDVVTLRVLRKTLSGSTAKVVYAASFYGLQPDDSLVAASVPVTNPHATSQALRFSIEQPYGTTRTVDWCVDQIG